MSRIERTGENEAAESTIEGNFARRKRSKSDDRGPASSAHVAIVVVERGYEAVATGEREALEDLFADDVTWRLMDRSEVARTISGKEAVVDFLLRIRELRLEAIMGFDGLVVAAHSFTLKSGGRVIATTAFEVADGLLRRAECSDIRRPGPPARSPRVY